MSDDETYAAEGSCFETHREDGEGKICIRPKGHGPIQVTNLWSLDPEYVRTTDVSVPLAGAGEFLVRAATAAEVALNFEDEAAEAYADGAADAIRFMLGLAEPTERLVTVLRAGRPEGDDFPEDQPLGYPIINRAF